MPKSLMVGRELQASILNETLHISGHWNLRYSQKPILGVDNLQGAS